MKILGSITLIIGILMLLAGMSGKFTQQMSHDTILMVTGPIFCLIGIVLIAYGIIRKKSDQ